MDVWMREIEVSVVNVYGSWRRRPVSGGWVKMKTWIMNGLLNGSKGLIDIVIDIKWDKTGRMGWMRSL